MLKNENLLFKDDGKKNKSDPKKLDVKKLKHDLKSLNFK
jgi:hypothetical protein